MPEKKAVERERVLNRKIERQRGKSIQTDKQTDRKFVGRFS